MRKSLFPLLFLLPAAAFATSPECQHSQSRDLQLDLSGVKAVVFDIGPHELKLDSAPGADSEIHGHACASAENLLEKLKLTQEKINGKLIVRAYQEGIRNGEFKDAGELGDYLFKNKYAHLKLTATLPDNIPVQLKVGSGDAIVTGASILSADVGSGNVEAKRIRGLVAAKVGSGDILLEEIGSLQVISVGSGDLVAERIRGSVKVGDIGSGDFSLKGAAGNVEIGSIGSGDAEIRDVSGNLSVDSLGSGDIDASGIRGDFSLRSKGSGSARHNDIGGRVSVPSDK